VVCRPHTTRRDLAWHALQQGACMQCKSSSFF
jgi:hypothetical protein